MSYSKSGNDADDDVHVISRDANEFNHPEHLDTPSFIQSLDLPTPTGDNVPLFDPFGQDSENHLYNDQHGATNGGQDFSEPPSLASLTDFVNHEVQLSKELSNEHSQPSYSGALTKIDHSLPPLSQLSEPVVHPGLHLQNQGSVPDFLRGSMGLPQKQQLLLGNKRKKEQQAPRARPAFVMKIWSMVNDPNNNEFIRWNDDGETFQVVNREEFMRNILPKYFKHNNFASFVRQLNMYGWHKIQDINSGSLKDDRALEEVLKFKNPYFIRGREDLLDKIVRNKASSTDELMDMNSLNLQYVVSELDSIKMNQLAIMEDMRRMRKDNQILWSESFTARDRHQKQAQTLEKIMKFLAAVYGNSAGKIFEVESNGYDNHQVSSYNNAPPNPNYNASNQPPTPVTKPRLMLMDQAYRKPSTASNKSTSVTPNGADSVEEIIRNTPPSQTGPGNENANKIFQQIMNPESAGISSPSQFFPELSNSYFNSDARGEADQGLADQNEEQLLGLEENIVKQGQALSQVQDWVQALANRQQKQQEELKQRQQSQNSQNGFLPNGDVDDFDVDDFLDNDDLPLSHQDAPSETFKSETPQQTDKRVIEEIQNDEQDQGRRKRRRR